MNRRHHSGGTPCPNACQGRIFGRFFILSMMIIAIVMAVWSLFLVGSSDNVQVDSKSSSRMVEQMVWNPSPK